MMTCKEAFSVLDAWEQGEADPSQLNAFLSHCEECPECASRFAGLIPLLKRDLPGSISDLSILTSPDRNFEDAVMKGIDLDKSARRKTVQLSKNRKRMPAWAMAAAAILILSVGVGIGMYVQQNSETATVHFVLEAPNAQSVQLAGDFNSWDASNYELKKVSEDGTWEITVRLTKGQVYAYNFVIDGQQWVADPSAMAQIDDGFGGTSSLLRL